MKLVNKKAVDHIRVVQSSVWGMLPYESNPGLKLFGITISKPWSGYRDIFGHKIQEEPGEDEVDIDGILFYKPCVNVITKSGEVIFHSRHETRELAEKEAFELAEAIGIDTVKL